MDERRREFSLHQQLDKNIPFFLGYLYKDQAFLRQKYVIEKLSPSQIAAEISSSTTTVYKHLRLAEIELRKEDKKNRSQLRYGEVWKDGRVIKNEREQENIAKMRELRVKGYSYWKIAEIFNSIGIRTKNEKRAMARAVYSEIAVVD